MPSKTLPTRSPLAAIPQRAIPHAVQFGFPATGDAPKAYPYLYNLIRYPYQQGIADPTTGIYSITGASAEGPDGLDIPVGGILNAPVVMDDDANFHLLYMKFGAFRNLQFYDAAVAADTVSLQSGQATIANGTRIRVISTSANTLDVSKAYYVVTSGATSFQLSLTVGGAAVSFGASTTVTYVIQDSLIGSREYLIYPYGNGSADANNSLFMPGVNARIPYYTELDVSVYMASSGARDLMGGFQRQPILGATQEEPIPLLDVQTSDDGLGMVKLPFQLTRSATVNLKFTSRSAYPLRVYGHLFGYKVTV